MLIGLLNPVIRGWANYHRHIVATDTFRKVDHEIWQQPLAVGQTPTSEKSQPMGDSSVTGIRIGEAQLDVCGRHRQNERRTGKPIWLKLVHASRNQNPATS